MLITILVILGLSFLVLVHEAAHFAVAKLFRLKIEEFGFGFPPRLAAWKRGETEYSINWLLFGGFVKIAGENDQFDKESGKLAAGPVTEDQKRYFLFQPAWKKSFVILAGVVTNFIVGWLLISGVLMHGTPSVVLITDVAPGSPAAAAQMASGDIVKNFADTKAFIDYVNANKGRPITLDIDRNGRDVQVSLTPRQQPPEGQGALGVGLTDGGTPKEGFFSALWDGLREAWTVVLLTLSGFWALVTGLFVHARLVDGVVGPVGIFSVAQQTGKLGLIYLLQLLSLISINLAVVNLVPFPALDGGRFFMILIEKLKGSPMPRKFESVFNAVGFAFLIFLMVILTIRDVGLKF